MKEYLKMSDVFIGKYNAKRRTEAHPSWRCGENYVELHGTPADYAAHAINSHDELVARVNELESFLHHFVDNSYNVDAGGADFTATTCEALEMAEKLDNRAYDGVWHGH